MKGWLLRAEQWTRQFWFIPAVMTALALILAEVGISLEERYGVAKALSFAYSGGESGARSVLSAVGSSSIGVAGTVFSITIAALSYAAGNMGPRLLDNFTRDRGNQVVLGVFIATFTFSIYTLRSVTGSEETPFVPHYNVSVAMLLALACVAALVYYLAHVTSSINMTRVVNLLRDDLRRALDRATEQLDRSPGGSVRDVSPPPEEYWAQAEVFRAPDGGYLQLVDIEGLVARAEAHGVSVRLHVRAGDYVFPHSPVAQGVPDLPDGLNIMGALTLGKRRVAGQDLEYSVRQLSEVAARALSPGVNDPVTAMDVIDRFGDALCRLNDRRWPNGVYLRGHQVRLVMPATSFGGLLDAMFTMPRQYGKGSPAVTLRMLEVFQIVAECIDDPLRRQELLRHARLVLEDAQGATSNSQDLADLNERFGRVERTVQESGGPRDGAAGLP
ncbi:DUF2254 domain-containing protein [Deinococcus knuensis]|uniref:DUF2254 domain-containing protein n=1 Tax=Deinococcus knuensis TaxID=1837380 RepID=A0ABQ2SGT5_9DEIO|nr:DUF2254 domain-containing protein [Deinococcus knuensis]GGS28765.1 hypothetical protein GCM10008961_20560 [Deinococcus knuensis]